MSGNYNTMHYIRTSWDRRCNMMPRKYSLLAASCVVITSVIGCWLFIAVARGNSPYMAFPPSAASEAPDSSTSSMESISSDNLLDPVVSIPKNPAKLVDLGYVKYIGIHNNVSGINYYRGIKYALPPTKQYRWKPPRSIESENVFDGEEIIADTPGPACYQVCGTDLSCDRFSYQSEDCLYLNVLVPDNPISSSLPVVVMIHGGGYYTGNAYIPGDAIVHSSKGQIIYVSIQYRLGMFGFLAGSEVKKNGVLNAGLLDQRCALEWVQRNIKAFGGDPFKITIWGMSAGGGSVIHQMMAYGGSGSVPFRAVISEYPWQPPLLDESSQDMIYRSVLISSGCDSLNCLRNATPEILQGLNNDLFVDISTAGCFYFNPVVDGHFVQETTTQAFKSGRYHRHVNILIDHNKLEGYTFVPMFENQVDYTTGAKAIFPNAGPSFFSRLYQLYPIDKFENFFWQAQAWFTDVIVGCPTYCFASSAVDYSENSAVVFKMLFEAGSLVHGATIPFLLSEDVAFPLAKNNFLAEVMSSYWVSFIVTMDPNQLKVEKAPFWPSYSADGLGSEESGESVGFDVMTVKPDTMFVQTDPDASPRCHFFLENAAVVRI